MRAFLAVETPEPIRRLLASTQRRLQSAGLRLKWVEPDRIHLTLRFLGETPRERIAPLSERLRALTAGRGPFPLTVRGVGLFPPGGLPRVLWAGVGGDLESLSSLAREIERASREVGWPPEDRPFHPHLTLARVRPGPEAAAVRRVWRGQGPSTPGPSGEEPRGEFLVSRVILFESELLPSGARHTPVTSFALTGVSPEKPFGEPGA